MKLVFEQLFEKNNWQPLEYNGKRVAISDTLHFLPGKRKFSIRFEEVHSEWEQGIFLKGAGVFLINDETFTNAIYLWHKTSTESISITFDSIDGVLKVWNIWRIQGGPMQYGHNGAALYFDEMAHGKRYYCNDGFPDDDFNDIIFTIESNELNFQK